MCAGSWEPIAALQKDGEEKGQSSEEIATRHRSATALGRELAGASTTEEIASVKARIAALTAPAERALAGSARGGVIGSASCAMRWHT